MTRELAARLGGLIERKCPLVNELVSQSEEIRIVDRQHVNCDSAEGRFPGKDTSTPLEMVSPPIQPWMEQSNHFAC